MNPKVARMKMVVRTETPEQRVVRLENTIQFHTDAASKAIRENRLNDFRAHIKRRAVAEQCLFGAST